MDLETIRRDFDRDGEGYNKDLAKIAKAREDKRREEEAKQEELAKESERARQLHAKAEEINRQSDSVRQRMDKFVDAMADDNAELLGAVAYIQKEPVRGITRPIVLGQVEDSVFGSGKFEGRLVAFGSSEEEVDASQRGGKLHPGRYMMAVDFVADDPNYLEQRLSAIRGQEETPSYSLDTYSGVRPQIETLNLPYISEVPSVDELDPSISGDGASSEGLNNRLRNDVSEAEKNVHDVSYKADATLGMLMEAGINPSLNDPEIVNMIKQNVAGR